MALTPGTRVGVYEVTAQIGEGGMGQVYRARDTKLDRDVAIKILPEAFAHDAERLARFQREAKSLASLNHPNIAIIHGLEQAGDVHALVMELVEGDDLSQRIARGAIPVDEALPIAKQIAEALEAAHEQGIIHRDLKPANVKVRPDGTVKVLDFGLAKALEPTGAMSPGMSQAPTITTPAMTMAGMILGTAAYMSPEQAKGKTVDKRSDVWAFGAVLYEMLAGKRAFDAEDVSETLAAVLMREPDWAALPATTPPTVTAVLRRCLQRDRKQRVRDIGDVALALEGAFETGAAQAAASVVVPQPVYWRRALPVALAASLVTAVVVGLVAWSLWPSASPLVVTRSDYDLPEGQQFRTTERSVLALSPDGRAFVYTTVEGLYLRAMGDLEARLIPGTEGALALTPFFSPNGQSVAYFDVATFERKRVATSGGAPVVISATGIPFGASWGSDDAILFAQTEGILRVSANGGTPALVIPAEAGEQMDSPQLLPDGESVLFSVTTSTGATRWDEAQIVVQSLRTGERTVIWEGGSAARYVPTGHLVYALRDGLYAIAFDVDSLTVSGGPVPMVAGVQRAVAPGVNSSTANFGVSAQGSLVYVSGTAGSSDRTLALVGRDGVVAPLAVPPAPYLSPRLSPDGGRLVVQSGEDEGNTLWIYDLSSDSQIQQLTFEGDNHRPIWTPDGQRITFASDREGPMSLYWTPADGSGVPERLTTAEAGTSHWPQSWSPDGQTLLFNVQREVLTDWDIWSLSVTGRETQRLYDTPETLYLGAELSPDGEWLAYGAGAIATAMDIYVEPFPPTGSRRRISQDGGYWPLWSRAGDRLFYRPVSTTAGITLRSVDIATQPAFAFSNEQTLPIDGFVVVGYYRDYDITPDGERLVMVFPADRTESGEAARPQIIVVQNWFEELRRLVPTN